MNQQSHVAPTQLTCAVRAALPGDHDEMANLAGQLGYECTAADVRARLAEMLDPNDYAVYVAELPGGQVAGWIGVYMFRSVELDSFAEISGLVVDQQVRSRGIGMALLSAAEQWARSHGCKVISVRSNVGRDRAHGFYASNGYEHIKTQKEFRKSLRPNPVH
jgi:GNAT superfamily N-acetyltransferase